MFKAALALIALAVVALASISCGSDEPSRSRWRLVLEPEAVEQIDDLDVVVEGVIDVAKRRITEFGGDVASIKRTGDAGVAIEFTGLLLEDAEILLEQTGLLQFCEPVTDEDGNVAIVRGGSVNYEAGTCEPERDEAGGIVLNPRFDRDGNMLPAGEIEFVPWAPQGAPGAANNPPDNDIVWQLATGRIEGEEIALDSTYLRPNTSVAIMGFLEQPTLFFEFEGAGVAALEQVTERLSQRNYPIAVFIDGEPLPDSNGLIIAPQVVATLDRGQGVISGLSEETAEELSMLLNSGAYPATVRIVEVTLVGD